MKTLFLWDFMNRNPKIHRSCPSGKVKKSSQAWYKWYTPLIKESNQKTTRRDLLTPNFCIKKFWRINFKSSILSSVSNMIPAWIPSLTLITCIHFPFHRHLEVHHFLLKHLKGLILQLQQITELLAGGKKLSLRRVDFLLAHVWVTFCFFSSYYNFQHKLPKGSI